MNQKFPDIQYSVVNQFKMNDRIEILNKKIEYTSEVVKISNVMNNLFKFYLPECIKIETILVVYPNIGTMLTDLQIEVMINN
ncbi:uncharacterized protein V1478_006060 [Vespula squamosa]|uniref:Uncharacterized protein n=1 Tax=Vespula squamosa TaxID=30214 RepID=A0ABD2B969_VESSQ